MTKAEEEEPEEKKIFFNQKGLNAAYIMYSLMILLDLVHFGVMFAYTLEYFICKRVLLT